MRSFGVLLCGLWVSLAQGCSDFRLNSSTHVVSGRTMDFLIDLHTIVEIVPRHTVIKELIVDGCADCPDFKWRAKHGFVGLNTLGLNAAADGLNEKGLSAGFLFLVDSQYPAINLTSHRPIVSSLVTYILGNFATVDQVKAGLGEIQVGAFDGKLQALTTPGLTSVTTFALHVPVHDATGKSIVIEFLNGTMEIYDNPVGVLTNDPPFVDQLALLDAHDHTFGTQDRAFAGGYSPVDRFQRLAFLNRHADVALAPHASYSSATPTQASVSAALHIINTVAIPAAYMLNGVATQYTLVRDHQARVLYFTSNENQVVRSIDLAAIDFADSANRRAIDVNYGAWHVDVTPALLASPAHSMDLPPRSVVQGLLHGLTGSLVTATPTHALSTGLDIALGLAVVAVVVAFAVLVKRRDAAIKEESLPLV